MSSSSCVSIDRGHIAIGQLLANSSGIDFYEENGAHILAAEADPVLFVQRSAKSKFKQMGWPLAASRVMQLATKCGVGTDRQQYLILQDLNN